MTHTEHYELSQWQKSDRLMMSDFNADNQKLDAALATLAAGQLRIVHGSYTGNGEASRTIALTPAPQALVVLYEGVLNRGNNTYGGVVFDGAPSDAVQLTDGGFIVKGGTAGSNWRANMTGNTYHYLAIYWPE